MLKQEERSNSAHSSESMEFSQLGGIQPDTTIVLSATNR